jgi:CheY-like chemotaxis protein
MKPIRVLLADHDPSLRSLYSRGLPLLGFEVATAASGLDCVAMLRSFRPDVLVLEPDLLWGQGEGVLARMREDADVPSVPVLLHYKGVPPERYKQLCVPPVEGDFMKPLSVSGLVDRINRIVASSREERLTASLAGDGRGEFC